MVEFTLRAVINAILGCAVSTSSGHNSITPLHKLLEQTGNILGKSMQQMLSETHCNIRRILAQP